MEKRRISHIVLAVLAVAAAVMLFATYGTVLPAAPFAPIQLGGPTTADSDGEFTAVVDTESRRVLIMNADGDLTGVVSCLTADSPIDAITDVCVSKGYVYVAGVRYEPDSSVIAEERLAFYDKGGNYKGIVFSIRGDGDSPDIKALCDVPEGVAVAYERTDHDGPLKTSSTIAFDIVDKDAATRIGTIDAGAISTYAAAFAADGKGDYRYATLSVRGVLSDGKTDYASETLTNHVFTAIDIEGDTLYACDDETGALCAIDYDTLGVNALIEGSGYHSVHVNNGIVSLTNSESNIVKLCDTSGAVKREFTEAKPSIGFSARMLAVWASGLYLAALVIVRGFRKVRRMIKDGKTESFAPLLTAVAVVTAITVAVGSLSFASYQKMLELRANEINMCADYLKASAPSLSEPMEKAGGRNALRGSDAEAADAVTNFFMATYPAMALAQSAQDNGIGLYCSLYGRDDKGIFYLYGTTSEYVMGSSARGAEVSGLEAAFEGSSENDRTMHNGRTLRDATQYRLVQIPTSDEKGVVGVIEIGSKTRSFESSIAGDLAQRILALLVLILVVYLAYSELRACGRCLFSYRQRQKEGDVRGVAVLTRPFTLAITMLTSIDSVMTVLIARDLLAKAGMGESSPLLAVPAVMLGVGMIIGQGIYAATGRRIGLRKLVASGAFIMLVCACATGAAVHSGIFWLYCVAKLLMAVPFGMLYSLGFSLPRLAADDETRALAAGGVKRTETSAAALGTVLGGYVAQTLGNVWVYVLVAAACLPVILIAINLLPRGMQPLEKLAQPDSKNGRIRDFTRTPIALGIALFIILPATLASGYASFLFPLYSADLGLSKSDINNIFVLGQLVVYVSINAIERMEDRHGKWKVATLAIAMLGLVFLLFAINTTLVWSVAVIALVGVLCKSSYGWKAMWLKAAGDAGVPTGRATSAMFAARSLALVAQPFILGALLGAADSIAVIVIGLICAACAGLFFLVTRHTSLAK